MTFEITGDVLKDFRHHTMDRPCRCGKCGHYVQRGEEGFLVDQAAHFSENSYEERAKASATTSSWTTWCRNCTEGRTWLEAKEGADDLFVAGFLVALVALGVGYMLGKFL